MMKIDNEKEIFLRSFKKLENQIEVLPVSETQIQRLKSLLSGIQKTAKNLALYDPLTHAMNTRAGEWLFRKSRSKGWQRLTYTIFGRQIRSNVLTGWIQKLIRLEE